MSLRTISKPSVTIVGIGLMGGSLGLALRQQGHYRVVGLSRRETTLREARRRGVLDGGFTDPARALAGANVVVYCSPVDQIVPMARSHRPFFSPDALLMDVGSVKGPIVRDMEKLFPQKDGPIFVGAHPMAGSEKTGVENARADLYHGALCALTRTTRTSVARLKEATAFWESVGARTRVMDPATHDRAVALVSHLPHLIADALALSTRGGKRGTQDVSLLKDMAAGSFRDATRVAGADPHLWRAIFRMNDRSVREALGRFSRELSGLARSGWSLSILKQAQSQNSDFRKERR